MTDEYRLKESMYRKRSFIALKLAISLHLPKDSTIFIQSLFYGLNCACAYFCKNRTCALLGYSRYKVHNCSLDCI
jgi:hypothetical protein